MSTFFNVQSRFQATKIPSFYFRNSLSLTLEIIPLIERLAAPGKHPV